MMSYITKKLASNVTTLLRIYFIRTAVIAATSSSGVHSASSVISVIIIP